MKKTRVSELEKLIGANVNKKSEKNSPYVVMRSSVKSNDFKTLCSNKTVLENVFVGLHEANLKTTKSNRSYKNMLLI